MKKTIVGVLMAVACSGVLANGEDEWVTTAQNDDVIYSMRKGTGEISKNKAGDDIYVLVARLYEKKTQKISLEKKYVRLADCLNKHGEIVALGLDGQYLYENDFVFDAGSIASANAEFICAVFLYELGEKNKKGI